MHVYRIALAAAFILIAVPAFADAPPLHFYNAQTGATAVGSFGKPGIDDNFHQRGNPGTFSPNWTYVVHVPNTKFVFAHNAATGASATASLNMNGRYVTAKSYGAGYFTQGWTSITTLRPRGLLFYRAEDGLAAITHVADDGSVATIGSYTTPAPRPPLVSAAGSVGRGWSAVVGIETDNRVLFYNRHTGAAKLGTFGATFELQKEYSGLFSPNWSRIVFLMDGSGLNGVLVYYNSTSGSLAVGKLDGAGNHTTLHSYHFTPGFTSVVAMQSPWTTTPATPSQVFFYNLSDGSAALANITASGGLTFRSWAAGVFSPGWTSITYGN